MRSKQKALSQFDINPIQFRKLEELIPQQHMEDSMDSNETDTATLKEERRRLIGLIEPRHYVATRIKQIMEKADDPPQEDHVAISRDVQAE